MVKSLLLIVLLALVGLAPEVFAQSELTRQNLFDLNPFMPEHFEQRVTQFRAETVKTGCILFLGDSITEGADWQRLTGDSTVVNRGVGGDITFGVLKRLDEVIRRRPASLFILIGINDIGKDIPGEVIADNVRQIVQQIDTGSPETKVFVQTVLPVNPDVDRFPQHYDKNEHVMHLNRLLKLVTSSLGVPLIDLYGLFVDSRQHLDHRYTTDGLHLNAEGYRLWVDFLKTGGYL